MRIDIGCHDKCRPGFQGIDRRTGDEAFPLSLNKQSIPDNSVDEAVASHVLEHFGHRLTLEVLKEWVRVLKPGGMLRVAVPDFEFACKNAGHPHFEGWIFGGQTDENDFHEALFTRRKLENLLAEAGLENIHLWKSEIQDCASLPVSLNLCGTKPRVIPKIACALSLPRLGFNDNWGCISAALMPWHISLRRYTGAWWERSLQNVLEDLIDEGFEYAVTVDYDTMFTGSQFNSLLDAIMNDPKIDAVCAVQPQRGSGLAMCQPTVRDTTNTVMAKKDEPLQVDTGHFGLTIIRLEKLKGLRRPWFLNVPGKDGSWKRDAPGLVDADIYFWNQWKDAGRTLYMLPWVSIGHLENLVSKIDPATGENIHLYPSDWVQNNMGVIKVKREVKPCQNQ